MSEKEVQNGESQDNSEAEEKEVKVAENGDATEEKTSGKPPKEMHAAVLTNFGGLKSVKIQKKPEPSPAAGEVLINVKTCGLNFQDLMVRVGAIDSPPKTPFILGLECAGEIIQLGENVEGFQVGADLKLLNYLGHVQVGDRVVALPEYRAWAEMVAVPAKYVYKIPDDMSFAEASAITLNSAVAYILVFDLGNISPGKKILLHSAGGAVGQVVVQLCRIIDNVKIFGVASKGKHEAIKDTVDYLLERGSDYPSEIRKISPEGVDVVFDCNCGDECNRGYNLLRPMGKYILFGSSNYVTGETKSLFNAAKSWWQVGKTSPIKLFYENKNLGGFNFRHLLYQQDGAAYVREVVGKVFDLWKQKKLRAVIDSSWALEDVSDAMQKLHDRKNIGKLVLDLSLEPKPKPVIPVKGKKSNSLDKEEKKKEEDAANGIVNPQSHGDGKENTTS